MNTTIQKLKSVFTICIFTFVIAGPAVAQHGLDELRVAHLSEVRELRLRHDATVDSLRASHAAAMEQFKCAERDARRLCEPERRRVLEQIRCDRRTENKSFRTALRRERARFKVAVKRAKSHYDLACSSYREAHRPVALPCGCAVNHCTCRPTPALPITRPTCTLPLTAVEPVRFEFLVPEIYRFQTVERVRRPVSTCAADRSRTAERPIAHLIRALLAQNF